MADGNANDKSSFNGIGRLIKIKINPSKSNLNFTKEIKSSIAEIGIHNIKINSSAGNRFQPPLPTPGLAMLSTLSTTATKLIKERYNNSFLVEYFISFLNTRVYYLRTA